MINTNRLFIRPLSRQEMLIYFKSPLEVAKLLRLSPSASISHPDVIEAMKRDLLPGLMDDEKNPKYYCLWIMVEKSMQAIVGSLCFHGEPDENGFLEVGYGVDEVYQNKGYMTEALSGLVQWAANQKLVCGIIAETEIDNPASMRVLEKCGFSRSENTRNSVWYKRILR